jgi:hypothetical protein
LSLENVEDIFGAEWMECGTDRPQGEAQNPQRKNLDNSSFGSINQSSVNRLVFVKIAKSMIRRAVHARSLRPAARRCLSTTTVKSLLFSAAPPAEGDLCAVDGWVRSVRTQKHVAFVALGDGTTLRPLQVVLPPHQAAG